MATQSGINRSADSLLNAIYDRQPQSIDPNAGISYITQQNTNRIPASDMIAGDEIGQLPIEGLRSLSKPCFA